MSRLVEQPSTWEIQQDLIDDPEHNLFESIIVEKNDVSGFHVDYYRINTDKSKYDQIYGEDPDAKYIGPFRTKVSYTPVAEVKIVESFGMFQNEVVQFVELPQFTFHRDVCQDITSIETPNIGDIIVFVWNNRNYEVTGIEKEGNIFISKKFSYDLVLKPMTFSSEDDLEVITDTLPLSAFSDSSVIETESNKIDNYSDTDTSIYGY
jgi:hypothetical protein